MPTKRSTTQDRHVPAFHVKDGPMNVPAVVKSLRQIRHGLEEHTDPTADAISKARDHIDDAITLLKRHVYISGNGHQPDDPPPAPGSLHAST